MTTTTASALAATANPRTHADRIMRALARRDAAFAAIQSDGPSKDRIATLSRWNDELARLGYAPSLTGR